MALKREEWQTWRSLRGMDIKLSVIMPSLNVAEYIEESINSALNQTLEQMEIICIDAGSEDGTWEI